MSAGKREHEPRDAEGFVLRAAVWPFTRFAAWCEGLAVPECADGEGLEEACRRDRATLAARFLALGRDLEFRAALRIAAPELEARLDEWIEQGAPAGRIAAAVTRYFTRMTSRATPFGLFAGWTLGEIAAPTRLRLSGRAVLRARLDAEVFEAIAAGAIQGPDVAGTACFEPNDSLAMVAGRLRYVAVEGAGERRTHVLRVAEPDAALTATLARSTKGATVEELAAPLATEHDVPIEEARTFVGEMVERQLLVACARPVVTTMDGLEALASDLPPTSPTRERLAALRRRLRTVETAAPGDLGAALEAAAVDARDLAGSEVRRDALQVDLQLPATEASLAPAVVAEIERAARVLEKVAQPGLREMERFRVAFRDRYEGEEIPLAEALDPEIGVAFGPVDPRAEGAPWLAGLDFPEAADADERRLARLHDLLGRDRRSADEAAAELVLTESDLEALAGEDRDPLPDAFSVLVTLVAHSPAAVDTGEFRLLVDSVFGPSGARLLGRFADTDAALRTAVTRHLAAEEALRPDVVFAEVVHVPEGRLGNVIGRPPFRGWEIPFLGRGGAPADRRLPISDLTVSLEGDRVVLRSRRLGREVVPRITNAHNYRRRSLPLSRFLGSLQSQDRLEYGAWDWGDLARHRRLPRVTAGKLVLARARWRTASTDFVGMERGTDAERLRAVRRWRAAHGIPRRAVLADLDHRLLVDFENLASLDGFLPLVLARGERVLEEWFPDSDDLVLQGSDGCHVHELLVPFVRRAAVVAASDSAPPAIARAAARPGARRVDASFRRVFAPGSEWLYARLFTGPAGADSVLRRVVGPLIEELDAGRGATHWFFLRYADPDWHVRLRVHGEPAWLREVVMPALEARVAPLLDERTIWRMTYDTYRREVERYGGVEGLQLAETLFECDSRWALAVVRALTGDSAPALRTQALLFGMARRLVEFGLDAVEREALLARAREGLARSLRLDRAFERQLDASFRERRRDVETVLISPAGLPAFAPVAGAWEALAGRGAEVAARIAGLAADGELGTPLDSVVASHLHMLCNRVLRSAHSEQELVLYDTLLRVARSEAARAKHASTAQGRTT